MDAQQVAKLFFLARVPDASQDDAAAYAALLDEFALSGYRQGLEMAKSIYREMHPGGCKMLSQGELCECFLCRCDKAKQNAKA